jgi:hypothetical protein
VPHSLVTLKRISIRTKNKDKKVILPQRYIMPKRYNKDKEVIIT